MVKYFLTSATVLAAVLPLVAETETETVDGYTWSYRINGDTVELLRVSPNPSGTVVIPSSLGGKPVTSIGESAFDSCNDLVGVAIPNSVTNIGEYAFYRCGHLAGVTIPSSVAYVGFNAFYSCDNLTNIVVHAGTIANWAFSYCGSFAWEVNRIPLSLTIGESVTNIGEQAFSFCYGLRDLTIPANVATIGQGAFDDVGVTNLFIDVEYVGRDGTIFSHSRGDGVPLTVVLGNHVKHVGNRFLYQETIDSLTIGENVETIGECAFYECWGLTNVKIPDSVRDIGDWAFTGDGSSFETPSALTNVTLGCGVTNIGAGAFSGSVGVTSVTIPESVQSIGDYAFSFCTNLTCIEFWGNAPIIGNPCFANVNPSCTVYVKTNSTGWGVDIPGTWNGLAIQYMTPEIEWLADRGMTADARAANGRTAAECYVLGLDPVDATNDFRIVSIEMVDGKPKVEWEPKTNRWTGAEIQAVLKGAATLDGEWQTVTEENKAGFRFFKVVVELP